MRNLKLWNKYEDSFLKKYINNLLMEKYYNKQQ